MVDVMSRRVPTRVNAMPASLLTPLAQYPQGSCNFTLPVMVYSLQPVLRRRHWVRLASQHRIRELDIQPAVNAADDVAMRRWAPGLINAISRLSSRNRRKSDVKTPLKRIAQWATAMQFFEHVLRRNTTTLHLDDDAILTPAFCEAGNRALERVRQGHFGFRQLKHASPAAWERRGFDALYFGHCYEFYGRHADDDGLNQKGQCHRVTEREFLSVACTPFCEHAYALSPSGAAKLLTALRSWNATYTQLHEQRVARFGLMWHDQPGRGGAKGVDFAIVKQIRRYNRFDAYSMWPQVVLQGWQVDVLQNATNSTDLLQHVQGTGLRHKAKSAKACAASREVDCAARASPGARLWRAADLQIPIGCFCFRQGRGWRERRSYRHLVNCTKSDRMSCPARG